MRQHVAERAEFTDFEFAVAHRFDLGVVAGRDEHGYGATDFLRERDADLIENRYYRRRRFVWLDAEPDAAVGTSRGVRARGPRSGETHDDDRQQRPRSKHEY